MCFPGSPNPCHTVSKKVTISQFHFVPFPYGTKQTHRISLQWSCHSILYEGESNEDLKYFYLLIYRKQKGTQ